MQSVTTPAQLLEDALELISLGYKIVPCNAAKEPVERLKGKKGNINKLRAKPLNASNIEYYLSGGDATCLSIFTGDNHEALDIEAKNDLTGKLKGQILTAIRYAIPDKYDQLVIFTTPSASGLHIHYLAEQIGGKQTLAKRYATNEERARGERELILAESFGEGVHIVTIGEGRELIQGSLADMPMLTAEERATVIAIVRSFDQVTQPELKGLANSQRNAADAPWVIFNREHKYEWMLDVLCKSGFSLVSEDEDRVYILRNGSNARISGSIWKASNILYLFSTSTIFEANKPYSAFGVHCQLNYDGKVHDCAKDLADQGIGTWNYDEGEFYSIGQKGKIEFKYVAIKQWMYDIGIRKYYFCPTDFYLVQTCGNKVDIITIDRIKKIFGDYIEKTVPEKVLNVFIASIGKLFTKEGLISQLEQVSDNEFITCTSKVGWMFFLNYALRVTKSGVEQIPYDQLPGKVWAKRIIQRNFHSADDTCQAAEFIYLIAGENKDQYGRFRLVLGYLLHLYKDPVEPKLIVFNDEFFDEQGISEPQGGTGKGLLIKLLKQFLQTLSLDGKRFDIGRNFAFQGITPDTQLLVIEDAKKGFNFETWFSTITEDLVVEKKGKDEYRIPFERAPKMLITTNYPIKGNSSSHRRRRFEIEVAPHFSNTNRPIDHFKCRFFEDWDEKQWQAFDNFMVNNLRCFLIEGLPEQATVNLEKKSVIMETSWDFFNWIEAMLSTKPGLPEKPVSKRTFLEKFTTLYPDHAMIGKSRLTDTKFTQWLNRWGRYRNIKVDSSQFDKDLGVMVYKFSGKLHVPKEDEKSYEVLQKETFKKLVNNINSDEQDEEEVVESLPF
jgi:hypothetical protein